MVHEVDDSEGLILAIDKFLHPNTFLEVVSEVLKLRGWKPESDHPDQEPVGATCNISSESMIYHAMYEELGKLFSARWKLARIFVNRFEAKEIPQFHRDHNAVTCLLYADAAEWHYNDHGETQLMVNDEFRGILPIPNRLLVFEGNLVHRATSFQTRIRHTISLQLDDVGFSDIVLPGAES